MVDVQNLSSLKQPSMKADFQSSPGAAQGQPSKEDKGKSKGEGNRKGKGKGKKGKKGRRGKSRKNASR